MSDKPNRRRGNNKETESGAIVNLLTQPPAGANPSNEQTSTNDDTSKSIESSQGDQADPGHVSKTNQVDPSKNLGTNRTQLNQEGSPIDPGLELNKSNQSNSVQTKSSTANPIQGGQRDDLGLNRQKESLERLEDPSKSSKKDQENEQSLKSKENETNKNQDIQGSKNQGKALVNPDYLSILGSKPSANHVNSDEEEDFEEGIDLTNKDAVFAKAMVLSVKGEGKKAAKYLKVYETLGTLTMNRPSTKRATSANPVLSDENKKIPEGAVFENGMWFFPGKTTSHTKRSYTPYFDKNIDELRYPIPLTIFDKDWQNKAMTCHVKKKSKSSDGEKSDSSYTGLPYADEWLLDYGEWMDGSSQDQCRKSDERDGLVNSFEI
ncbi:uncharacterized protein MELLADRAFT_104124 [Melampsora larici-populina 98AG31]|uniref:Uncharacterized protein n=1 Tax=Melampsora larici-populina (strain 98AG31 / pathotype 3-4-7) TaxID=747676 RepID=F4RDN4_MELLP|nr:uncharacterized protein MELLADRAFT_104124 [Melampsora larici-populina 98AG31]EGG09576.1 hypothetical protein MELLADRAFT_104124 [Melampsora larici-populina 98AG31]